MNKQEHLELTREQIKADRNETGGSTADTIKKLQEETAKAAEQKN